MACIIICDRYDSMVESHMKRSVPSQARAHGANLKRWTCKAYCMETLKDNTGHPMFHIYIYIIDTYTHIIYIYTYIYIYIYTYIYIYMYMSFFNINTVCLLLKYCCQTRKIINFEAFGPQINRNQETYLARCGTNKSKTTPTMSLVAYASHLWGDSEVTAVGFTVRFPKVESAVGSNLTG